MVSRRLIRRIERASASLPAPAQAAQPPTTGDEARSLAREMAEAFGQIVDLYRKQFRMTHEDAAREAEARQDENDHAKTCPPDQLNWHALGEVARSDPEAALARWQE